MKHYWIIILLCITLSSLKAENNTTLEKMTLYTPELEKKHQSTYDRFKKFFSKYDNTLMEDLAIYVVDMFVPDEMIRSTKDVFDNRKDKSFKGHVEHVPQVLSNDVSNVFLSTFYYYMQDISKITDKVWSNQVCTPSSFQYKISLEPKEPLLTLKIDDEHARGVTENGIVLPVNENFPHAFYPYAAEPNGCSAEGFQDLYDQSNLVSDDDEWLSEACNEHDRCYFTLGKTSQECNSEFIVNTIDACTQISSIHTIVSMGTKNAFCNVKALSIATGANSCAEEYFSHSQREQKAYMQWVRKYEHTYRNAIMKDRN
ncbi:MAG: Unknown protein [uncultured Sulfurovum sp.]|uniref:Phospholipase A2 domain-containing protein n=1 Tax=uncultured Sulfurovum sp. TaxID=269237 RepID=A0A6S6UHY1_9BACT|nr:MAG: Unknown protein [uncultured Sulfurovum sp.]